MKSDFGPRQVKPITVAIEVVPVIALLLVFVMAIAGLLYHSVKKQNEIATTTSLHLVRSGMSFFENDIREAVIEYSFWNEGAQNIIVDYNATWVKDNILDWVIAGANMDGCLTVGSQNRLIVGTSRDASHSYTDTSSFPDGLKKLIDAARSQPQTKGELIPPVSGYFRDESGVYLAAAALIQWSDGRAPPLDNNVPGVMVFYRVVTSSLLKGL
ncbi:MAG: CHASE4 domain-containing protein, partial [Alphaproteobacteria bacterium]|nr:CHASE4 domain-containing protein [Alphaproteobacteria bacterium]